MTAEHIDLDLISPNNLANPYPLYQALRETDPVHWAENLNAWVLTRYNDVSNAFRDPRFSAVRLDEFAKHQVRDPSIVKDYVRLLSRMMLLLDGPAHANLRRQVSPSFVNKSVERWRPAIERITDGLLDAAQAKGRFDVVGDFSIPFAGSVVLEIIGIPPEDREKMQMWGLPVARFFGSAMGDVEEVARQANEGILKLEEYLNRLVEIRRKEPREDLTSLWMSYADEGKMDPADIVPNLMLVFNAGQTTTIDQLPNVVYDLLTHPDELARLKKDPSLLPTAIEELLRFTPAMGCIQRIATEDVELEGKVIKKGQIVLFCMASANRDSSAFPDPDRLDLGRAVNKHLSFVAGPHLCLGAPVGRSSLGIALTKLFERMPNLSLDPQKPARRKRDSLVFHGFHELPVTS